MEDGSLHGMAGLCSSSAGWQTDLEEADGGMCLHSSTGTEFSFDTVGERNVGFERSGQEGES